MRISKKSVYALKALIELAINREKGVDVTLINDIAERENIPPRYLEHILLNLKNSGILLSKRGVGGGYTLSRAPEKISLRDVIRLFEGPLSPLGDMEKTGSVDDNDATSFVLYSAMNKIGDAMKDIAENISLADMARRTLDLIERKRSIPNYVI
jgi:Rrf2 family protein